jgi:hypothetical protein
MASKATNASNQITGISKLSDQDESQTKHDELSQAISISALSEASKCPSRSEAPPSPESACISYDRNNNTPAISKYDRQTQH